MTDHLINKNVVAILLKAPWFLQLKKLKLACEYDYYALNNAKNLLRGLQMGAIESLKIGKCSPDVLLAFENANLPKLKKLKVIIRSKDFDFGRGHLTGKGLNLIFNTANLPCLESLTVDFFDIYDRDALIREEWDHPPVCAENMEADPFSILPSLKVLCLRGIDISKGCAKFLASGFYKRGCEVDLNCCAVQSDLDVKKVHEMLSSFGVSDDLFCEEIRATGLTAKLFWFNLVSMEELHTIILSLYLSKIASDLESVIKPEIALMAAMPEKRGKSNYLAERMQSAAERVLKSIKEVTVEMDKVVGGNNGASGSRR